MQTFSSLVDRRVVVTGGSRGLGRVMAIELLRAGARVAIVSLGPSAPLNETLRQIKEIGKLSHVMCSYGDLSQADDCERVVGEIESQLGRIDVLINNAAIPMQGQGKVFWKIPPEEWLRMSHINCDSVFLMSRLATPRMVDLGFGKIINVSTGYGTMVRDTFSPYGPSKAFVEASTRIWASELKGTGVTVNALLPGGAVDTIADVTGVASPTTGALSASIMVEPTLWLASDESNGHTGERYVASRWDISLALPERAQRAREDSAGIPSIM